MSQVMGVMKMHVREKWGWIYTPWIILFFSFFVNLVISFLLDGNDPMYTGGLMSIYIYMLVMGMVTISQMFQFAIGLSISRKDFYLGTLGIFVAMSAGIAIVLLILNNIEQWSGGWGVNLHFFHLPYLNDGLQIEQISISFIVMLHMCYLGFVISSVFQRFGRSGLLIFLGVLFVLSSILAFLCTYYEWWMDIFYWIAKHTAFELALWMIPLVIIYMVVSYWLLRKATV
ncbi:hypothetical protein P9D39_12300 [Heyndrickxia oleronia]|uniref:Uncharacterized protein n=1 Tax=Heyndrickxia oleronia TaxID=38875 RepID=A0A8E2LGH3_9BACI|nr:hypothetical protein [Heyndrickxia oleronia]MBU5213782.1 hypothetical protein [Heyndrickxia oleronia]MEC1375077.1 hypothetical protein [Heyndrickxia oleronia]OOP69219.1 hypothetical protein BWZ43_06415 [Heyndrickxia oleronia]QQZ04498.1 hypothetical protein I5818_23055 [Heyndrickxia oleronia]